MKVRELCDPDLYIPLMSFMTSPPAPLRLIRRAAQCGVPHAGELLEPVYVTIHLNIVHFCSNVSPESSGLRAAVDRYGRTLSIFRSMLPITSSTLATSPSGGRMKVRYRDRPEERRGRERLPPRVPQHLRDVCHRAHAARSGLTFFPHKMIIWGELMS